MPSSKNKSSTLKLAYSGNVCANNDRNSLAVRLTSGYSKYSNVRSKSGRILY